MSLIENNPYDTVGTSRPSTSDSNSSKDREDRESDGVRLPGGTSSYISWSLASIRNLASKSIIIWMKIDSLADNLAIFGLKPTGGTDELWTLDMQGAGPDLEFTVGWSTANGVWRMANQLTVGLQQIAVTYSNSATTNDPVMYRNGVSKTVTENTTPSGTYRSGTSNTLNIGRTVLSNSIYGRILSVAIFNRILTANEILDSYRAGSLAAYVWAEKNANGLLFCPNLNMCTGISRDAFIGASIGASNKFLNYIDGSEGTPSGTLTGVRAS